MLSSLSFLLLALLPIAAFGSISLSRGSNCVSGSIGEFLITVDYTADNGDEKTASYSVPTAVSISADCESGSHGQEATIKLTFQSDVIEMKFMTSSNLIGKPIWLKKIQYNYQRDRRRFPLLHREDSQKMLATFSDGQAGFGVTGKTFKCTKMNLLLPNGIKFEMRNLVIGLFKVRDLYGEVTCQGSSAQVTEAPDHRYPGGLTNRPGSWGGLRTTPSSPRSPNSPGGGGSSSGFQLPIRFNKDRCVVGNALIEIHVTLGGQTHRYFVPNDAEVTASCSERSLRTKHAWLGFKWAQDSLNFEFTAPAVSGKALSLVNANYTVYMDRERFGRSSPGGSTTYAQTWEPGAVKVGEWHKFFNCPNFNVDLGQGVKIFVRQFRLALFSTPADADVKGCEAG